MTTQQICYLAAGMLLLINSVRDLLKHEILLFPTVAAGACGAVLQIIAGTARPAELMAASLPGLILILLSFLTGEKVGTGDGIIYLALAMWIEPVRTWFLFPASLAVAGLAGMGSFLAPNSFHRKESRTKQKEIPFVPCIFVAYLMTLFFS